MSDVSDLIAVLAIKASAAVPVSDGDYTGADGLLICGRCHTPKQCRPFPGSEVTVFCLCRCMEQADEAVRAQRVRAQIAERRAFCFHSPELMQAQFSADDGKNPKLTAVCKAYAERLLDGNCRDWLLLWGDCGTGKSYMAACIADAAISAGLTARFVTVPEVEQMLWKAPDKSAVYEELGSTGLLVLDDFGCERRTEYMDEIRFSLIDGRLRSGKPCVITTNLTLNEFAAPADRAQKRVVSRLFERVCAFHVTGDDRRFAKLRDRRAVPSGNHTAG